MNIVIVTPAAAPTLSGNLNTAQRWARLLKHIGHQVEIESEWDGAPADLMIALHAGKSYGSIQRFATLVPRRPLIVCLTGTDLYRDLRTDSSAQNSLELATRLVVLQEMALKELPADMRHKTHVIYQSAKPIPPVAPLKSQFEISVIGHLREEKDPFRCAMALRYLPPTSRIRVCHMGRAMSAEMNDQARQWMAREPRYRWTGEIQHREVRRRLARSRAMVISSLMEGGANVISEALVTNVPVIASRVPGNIGMLGEKYNGYFTAGDERELAALLLWLESNHDFRTALKNQCRKRVPLVLEKCESKGLEALLADIKRQRPGQA
ncbi:MAG TPA: selenoneine biosynthesis selenosugar synthase SenB [Burkholderiales bacterium]|nr:selenoneine biosynthesis selenosugar synthase SenB [Burkholderiales bacterium]